MMNDVKKFLEWNDLTQLHIHFGEEDAAEIYCDERAIPKVEMSSKADIWTEAIKAASSDQVDFIQIVHVKVKHSDLTVDGKNWWDTILSIGMNAPLEELERLLKTNISRRSDNKADYVRIATQKLAYDAVECERTARKKREQEEIARLKKLQEEANKRQQEKDIAEYNLKQHRNSQGGRR